MKRRNIIVLISATILWITTCGQNKTSVKVPEAAKSAFASKFPAAKMVNWVKEPNSNYEAKFMIGEKKERAEFDSKGVWVETENSVKASSLPQTIRDAVAKKNAACKISEAEKVQTAYNGTEYDVGCTLATGKKEYRVSADGTTETEIEKK